MLATIPADAAIAIRTVIALVFLSAALGKFRHWRVFQGVVANYRLLPRPLIAPVAYLLPPLEAVIGTALLTGRIDPWTEFAAAVVLAAFAAAMGANLLRGRRYIDCGCFQGTLKQTLRWRLVARNAVMVSLLGLVVAIPASPIDGWAVVNGLLAGCAIFVVVQSLNTLWAIRRPAVRQPRGQLEGLS
jgi:Methylamine utilisation protein MauE